MTKTMLTLVDGEVHVLNELLGQLLELFDDADESDPALKRLSPAAYQSNDEAAAEFRRLTHADLLSQRSRDAAAMLSTLTAVDGSIHEADADGHVTVELTDADVLAWMRTLAALRLVMATRLGIGQSDDHDHDDPSFALYDWLGYRLETLVEATDN